MNKTPAARHLAKAKLIHDERIPTHVERVDALTAQRDQAVAAAHAAGLKYREIADALGVSISYVQVMVQRAQGESSPSRRRRAETRNTS